MASSVPGDTAAVHPYAARSVNRFRKAQSGQGMVEYALILVMVSVVVIVVLITTGGQIKNMFSDITCTVAWSSSGC
jgi:pilus assembly protein Flp/PilA